MKMVSVYSTRTSTKIRDGIKIKYNKEKNFYHILLGSYGNSKYWISIATDLERKIKKDSLLMEGSIKPVKNKKYYILVNPTRSDNKIILFWRFRSGYRGEVKIEGDTIKQIKYNHGHKKSNGNSIELISILEEGKKLVGRISGINIPYDKVELSYNNNIITEIKKKNEEIINEYRHLIQ